MIEEFLKNVVTEARKQYITKEKLIERLTEAYEEAEERDIIDKKDISQIAKRIENLFLKIYQKEQIELYIEVVEALQKSDNKKNQICAICEGIDGKYKYNKGHTYGRINTMTGYILFRILKFNRIEQRQLKKLLKPIYGGSTPYITCILYYEFDMDKIKKLV